MYADCLPQATVTIKVNNVALPEYHTENASESDAMTATTFVESTPGTKFEIHLRLDAGFAYRARGESICFSAYADGEHVGSNVVDLTHLPITSYIEGLMETKAGISTLRKLSFAEHTSTDGHCQPSLVEKFSKLGEIKVELTRCLRTGTFTQSSQQSSGTNKNDVPEKALKGRSISNHTQLGRAENIPAFRFINVTYPHGKDAIATYIFQYRTRRDLEIEGIVERPQSPVPLTERDPDELTPDELREQVRLLRAERASSAKVKQEVKHEKRVRDRSVTLSDGDGNEDDDEGDVTITSESNKRRKRARTSAEVVDAIDLTED